MLKYKKLIKLFFNIIYLKYFVIIYFNTFFKYNNTALR